MFAIAKPYRLAPRRLKLTDLQAKYFDPGAPFFAVVGGERNTSIVVRFIQYHTR